MTTPPSPQDETRASKTDDSAPDKAPSAESRSTKPASSKGNGKSKSAPRQGSAHASSTTGSKHAATKSGGGDAKKRRRRRVRKGGSHAPSGAKGPNARGTHASSRSSAGARGKRAATGNTGKMPKGAKRAVRVKGYNAVPKHSVSGSTSKMSAPIVAGIVVAALLVLVGGFFAVRTFLTPRPAASVEAGKEVTVVIPEGADGGTIVKTLLDAGVIGNARDFRRAVSNQNADQLLRCGTYTFLTGSDPQEVVRQLVSGPNSTEGKLQLPEGLTMEQTAQLVESSLGIPAADFLAQAKASNYSEEYPFLKDAEVDSLEGFLYPKTYDLAGKEATADGVIRMMLTQFYDEFSALDTRGACKALSDRYGLTVTNYDIIKIASIIEEEALNEDDRAKVSSVFYNRLSTGMALQSDATMGYVTGGAISSSDLNTDSPYNTYLYKGLPPTPICSPSKWAIEAAMYPADTQDYYFFIIEDGDYSNHTFSKTYEEHDKAYQAALAEKAGASSVATGTVANPDEVPETTTEDAGTAPEVDV